MVKQFVKTTGLGMIPARLEQITEAHLQDLIETGAAEGKAIDFKRDLPGRDNQSRHDLLADVCAFANVAGGDLVFGMDEDGEGVAREIVGQDVNPDHECLRLQDICLNGLEPRLTGIHAHPVTVAEGRFAFVVRVPQSWNPPHRVKTNNHFYIREGRRKRNLDVPELRTAVIQSEDIRARVRNFRSDRVGKIIAGETPVPLREGVIEVLHILPLSLLRSGSTVDVLQYTSRRQLPIISGAGDGWRLNIDGVLHSRNVADRGCGGYTQLFRDGAVEAVRVFTTLLDSGRYNIPSTAYEQELITFFDALKLELAFVEASPPLVLLMTILHANKAELGIDARERFALLDQRQGQFDRVVIALPDVLIEDVENPSPTLLKPMFDLVWNAAGIQRSWNFDNDGNWAPRR